MRTVAVAALPVFVVFPLTWTAFPFTPSVVLALSGAASLFGGVLAVRRTDERLAGLAISGGGTLLGAAFGYMFLEIAQMTISAVRLRMRVSDTIVRPLTLSMWFDRTTGILIGNVMSPQYWILVAVFGLAGIVGGGVELLRKRRAAN